MHCRRATLKDCRLLGQLNHQLIHDEKHPYVMSTSQLAERMRRRLQAEYRAVIFEDGGAPIAYVLYRDYRRFVHLRHFFVVRERRRSGVGRRALESLIREVLPPNKRLLVEVLCHNQAALAFWRAMGLQDYSLTLELRPEIH